MSYDFSATGSEPVELKMAVTFIDQEAIDRYFGPPESQSFRIRAMHPLHECPECGQLVDGGIVKDVTVTPGARAGTFEIHGKSVTYTPCGHEARWETTDQSEGQNA